ncbi:MAG TPA: Imm10 family immunity protein [Pyrinomonadaceae bacterium]|nr:Imm10 family immunity protein [Pyrinomonadaceae bacterium]
MIIEFQADEVEVGPATGAVINAGFYTEGNYLSFQRMIDEELGNRLRIPTDTHYAARDDQSYGEYGVLEKVVLSRTTIEVTANETGKEIMQCDGVKVGFDVDNEKFANLRERLGQIFGEILTVVE